MSRDELLQTLGAQERALVERFGVTSLVLFGSFASHQATITSDFDFLVRVYGPATSSACLGVLFYLKDLLGRPVNLVTERTLRPDWRPRVELQAVNV